MNLSVSDHNGDNGDLIRLPLGYSPLFLLWIRFNPSITKIKTRIATKTLPKRCSREPSFILSQVQTVILVHLGLIITTNSLLLGFVYSDFPIPHPFCLQFLLRRRPSASVKLVRRIRIYSFDLVGAPGITIGAVFSILQRFHCKVTTSVFLIPFYPPFFCLIVNSLMT